MNRPNIVYLHSHDTGRYMSPYGHAVDTPNLQRFANDGVLFRQAFCANPTCSPSRASLITGSWPHRNGMFGLAHRGFALNDYRQTWLTTFKQLGYHTVITGQEHYGIRDETVTEAGLGFETDLLVSTYGEDVAPVTCDFLEKQHNRPFFLDAGFFETHRTPMPGLDIAWHNRNDSPTGDPRHVAPPAPLPNTPQTRADFADFAVAVHRLDTCYGKILDTLQRTGLADNTLVIITTDHGIAFPRMKCSLTDDGIGVALMMRGPAGSAWRGGQVIDAMVSHTDVYPTLCELLGTPTPDAVDGQSMLPLLDSRLDPADPQALHDTICAQVNYHAAYEPKRCLRTDRYKYIRRFHNTATPVLPNTDASVSKNVWLDAGWADHEQPAEELYDLLLDPHEKDNLVEHSTHRAPDVLIAMRSRLDGWMRTHDDPIRHGPIPLPAGGCVNTHATVSPDDPPIPSQGFDPNHP